MRHVYNQKNLVLTVNGVTIQDFFEGAVIVWTMDGGEVQKTQGTDGAGINIATNQGATVQFTLRETSRSRAYLMGLRLLQENGGPGVTVVMRSGADVVMGMTGGYLGREGVLTTGDKTQGGVQWTIMSAEDTVSNIAQTISSI